MLLSIGLIKIAKLVMFLYGIGFLAMGCLWPIDDKPTSIWQVIAFIVAVFVWWFVMFGDYSISVSLGD